ncbi:Short-chain dehydrogenase/reductase [Lachnellula occidentalis]|uniref:Short-chain dehydrogenase/reductase n=1 Tax=Lachnellula occidentalis TaxID=215460 RepID=A0A8H8UH33_9HELO|nr:Short-chain dehydrogenase/reductase [Lachnellula occidentalis]
MASNPIVLITGANTGLGFEIVKALLQSPKPYTILLGGRSLEKAKAATQQAQTENPPSSSIIKAVQIDIESDSSITNLFDQISAEYGRVDVLINNAGASFDVGAGSSLREMRAMWNRSWDVNTTSTHLLTHTIAPLLIKSPDPRLLFMTSGTANLTGHSNPALPINHSPAAGWPKEGLSLTAYRSVKVGLNMLMLEWKRILGEDGVKVWSVSPGMLATGLGGAGPEALRKMGARDQRWEGVL